MIWKKSHISYMIMAVFITIFIVPNSLAFKHQNSDYIVYDTFTSGGNVTIDNTTIMSDTAIGQLINRQDSNGAYIVSEGIFYINEFLHEWNLWKLAIAILITGINVAFLCFTTLPKNKTFKFFLFLLTSLLTILGINLALILMDVYMKQGLTTFYEVLLYSNILILTITFVYILRDLFLKAFNIKWKRE